MSRSSRRFRLEQVLRVRHLQQDIAAAAAGAASSRVVAARGAADSLMEQAATQSFADHGDANTFAAVVAARSASSSRYSEALAAVEEAEAHSRAAQADWAHAQGRAKGLERLAERHRTALTAADLKADQAVIDEAAGRARGLTAGIEGPASLGGRGTAEDLTDLTDRGDGADGEGSQR